MNQLNSTPLRNIRGYARETVLNNPYAPVVVTLIYFAIKFGISGCFSTMLLSDALWAQILLKFTSLLVNIMLGLFVAGRIRYFTLLSEEKEASILSLFSAFRKGPDRVLKASLILQGIPFLCTLPGFVYSVFVPISLEYTPDNAKNAAIALSMVVVGTVASYLISIPFMPLYYILGDYVNMPLSKAVRMSFWLMKGNYFRYIGLCISLLPFFVLGFISFGVGFIWISPFIQSSYAHFYLDLISQKQQNNSEGTA